MRPIGKMVRRLTLSGTSVTSATKINLIRQRRGLQGRSSIKIGTIPLSGTMLLLLTK